MNGPDDKRRIMKSLASLYALRSALENLSCSMAGIGGLLVRSIGEK